MLFRSPTVAQMKQWKETLKFSGAQMANILGLKSARRWRDYADENKPQGIPPANLFMAAAITILPREEIDRVLAEMRRVGAVIELDDSPDSPEHAGGQEQ
jgi:hypothetical protein